MVYVFFKNYRVLVCPLVFEFSFRPGVDIQNEIQCHVSEPVACVNTSLIMLFQFLPNSFQIR